MHYKELEKSIYSSKWIKRLRNIDEIDTVREAKINEVLYKKY